MSDGSTTTVGNHLSFKTAFIFTLKGGQETTVADTVPKVLLGYPSKNLKPPTAQRKFDARNPTIRQCRKKKDMSIRYFIAIKSCTRLWCLLFHIICRDYTDYAFYLPGGAGIRTVTAIMTKRPWNPPKKISETLPVQWGANEFRGGLWSWDICIFPREGWNL